MSLFETQPIRGIPSPDQSKYWLKLKMLSCLVMPVSVSDLSPLVSMVIFSVLDLFCRNTNVKRTPIRLRVIVASHLAIFCLPHWHWQRVWRAGHWFHLPFSLLRLIMATSISGVVHSIGHVTRHLCIKRGFGFSDSESIYLE